MEIEAKILKDSINVYGNRVTTYELTYPKFIHSELMTHRLFSRNAASSRAIPTEKFITFLTAQPVFFGINKAGMAASDELDPFQQEEFLKSWFELRDNTIKYVEHWKEKYNLHKQIINRVLEPWFMIKTIVTATNYDNFFWLRSHEQAQPEIKMLSDIMLFKYNNSIPIELTEGQWHLPYIDEVVNFYNKEEVENYIKISTSCCAQVSYRSNDMTLEKALRIFTKLLIEEPVHASPAEHVATPLNHYEVEARKQLANRFEDPGIEYCGNLKGWKQYRKFLKKESLGL